MTRTLAGSLFIIAAATAVGCNGEHREPPSVTGGAGTSPPITSTGAGAICGTPMAGGGIARPGLPAGFPSSPATPQVGATHRALEAPPALSGGTLRILKDGTTAVAADSDRDRVYIVDLTKRLVTATVMLQKGDEPGRVVSDAAGRVHVALRRGGALVAIDPVSGAILERRAVCGAPRGIAYDPISDLLHVACADGELVSLPAAGGPATRTQFIDTDLRDVVIDGGQLKVTRFKSAQLLSVDGEGKMVKRASLPSFRSISVRGGQVFTPSVAWRAVEMPSGGVAVLHQRGFAPQIEPSFGGYGGFSPCDAIVQTAVTVVAPGQPPKTGPAMAGLVLAVDMAVSPDGNKLAIVAPGNATNSEVEGGPPRMPRVFVTDVTSASDPVLGCVNDGQHAPCIPQGMGGFFPQGASTGSAGSFGTTDVPPEGGVGVDPMADPAAPAPNPNPFVSTCGNVDGAQPTDPSVPQVVGEPIAVAYAGSKVVIQSREPAVLAFPGGAPIMLSTESRSDTGHALFHANSGGMIACASCHPEGNEDGRTWNFACEGTRRTQSLQVGLKGTEPFHWGGNEHDFSALVSDVFVGRMSGPELKPDQVEATLGWIDAQPRRSRTLRIETPAIARGRAIFNDSKTAACATCHMGGALTNNQTVDVGTGGMFQVPSLVGISTRGPFMHNGCAPTLKDRFSPSCGGGDKHGVTSKLTAAQIDDLVVFLETL